jgi:hypothetical protein
MALKKQSIRTTMVITSEGDPITKDEILKLSEEWTEFQESMFRKLLQQGGKSVINKIPFEVRIPEPLYTSKGELDKGLGPKLPGERTF